MRALFVAAGDRIVSMKINVHDFEQVISKNKKDKQVTLWYVEAVIDKEGKTDPVTLVNDPKIYNDKMVEPDEAIRQLK